MFGLSNTVAVLVSVSATVGVTVMVMVADAPEARLPRDAVTCPGVEESVVPWLAVAETKFESEGSTSFKETLFAASGPLFVTFNV